jgi:hypothetical protein
MKIKKRKVAITLESKAKRRRKSEDSSDEEPEDVDSFNKELNEIAERDPELYEFLKKEEADIFDEENEDYESSDGINESELVEQDAMLHDKNVESSDSYGWLN